MNQPELIIFDCDGVLVDSELLACSVAAATIQELGIPIAVSEVIAIILA